MSETVTTVDPATDYSHQWVIAADIVVDDDAARLANMRRHHTVRQRTTLLATDVYCSDCRQTWENVVDQPCSAKLDNRHLIGGDQDVRAKRGSTSPSVSGRVVTGPAIRRRGVSEVASCQRSSHRI